MSETKGKGRLYTLTPDYRKLVEGADPKHLVEKCIQASAKMEALIGELQVRNQQIEALQMLHRTFLVHLQVQRQNPIAFEDMLAQLASLGKGFDDGYHKLEAAGDRIRDLGNKIMDSSLLDFSDFGPALDPEERSHHE